MPESGTGRPQPSGGDAAEDHPLLTIRQAAVQLGCSDMTIRRGIAARTFPAVKIGTKAMVPRVFIERLLALAEAGRTVVVEEIAAEWALTRGQVAP